LLRVRLAGLGLADLGRRRLARRLDELPGRFGLHLANRFLERQALAGNVRFVQRRRHPAQLRQQRRARAFVERAAILALFFSRPATAREMSG